MALPVISSVRDCLELLGAMDLTEQNGSHVRFFFRGHVSDSWLLSPGVYRPNFKFHWEKSVEVEEVARLRTEQHLFQDFKVMSASLRSGRETNVELYFLQQHYGLPTRLLDWSNNPLAALYFATLNSAYDGIDGRLFLLDAYDLAQEQTPNADTLEAIRGVATSERKYLVDAVEVINSWKKPNDFGSHLLALRPNHFDSRMKLQQSCFTFHPPACPIIDVAKFNCVTEIAVECKAKQGIRRELALLGVNDFSIFGDLDHLATRLIAAYCR